jgi:hypothetical protein
MTHDNIHKFDSFQVQSNNLAVAIRDAYKRQPRRVKPG